MTIERQNPPGLHPAPGYAGRLAELDVTAALT
ncbi:hypothetical protein RAM_35990 [Amycolatopsis mediterranei S699]|uniref:Uncharacterized protein n=1 Tax=Amycolatopsis mediterranei (strain S699) TaxID=713604 RepID=A0A9R0UC98_AMYMS|nr:hypothetical protein RAM_35990 [Amycolatopsis mediterranei S699]